MTKKMLPTITAVLALSACASAPQNNLTSTAAPVTVRTEARDLSVDDPRPIVAAAAEILRNMGYEIDRSAINDDTVIAWKTENIAPAGRGNPEPVFAFLGGPIAIAKERKVRASFTAAKRPAPGEGVTGEIAFQRITWDTAGDIMQVVPIDDLKLYDGFFTRLSQRGALASLDR